MEEARYNIKGDGRVSITYDGITEFLEIEGKIIALNAAGPYQDMHNAFFVKGDFRSTLVNDVVKQINFAPDPQINFFVVYSRDIETLLSIFEPGTFIIEKPVTNAYVNLDSAYELVENFHSDPLRFTRSMQDLNQDTIEEYKQAINEGFYPLVLAYRKVYSGAVESCTYIIDGHHKLAAYAELKCEPNIWTIVNSNSEKQEPTDQRICDYLNHQEIKDTLKYFYYKEETESGKLTKLVLK